MLEFHVTNEIFQLTKDGKKTHEYRNFNDYWKSRLSKINEPSDAFIVRGYTKDKLLIRIIDISVMPTKSIDESGYRDFIKTSLCYDIEFKLEIQPLR